MPTFKPLGAKVQLVAYSLADSTSAKPQRSKQYASEDTRRAEQAVLQAPPLSEDHIPCLGDATRLHALDDVPFYLVQAGGDLFKPRELTLADRVRALIEKRENERVSAGNTRSSRRASRDDSAAAASERQQSVSVASTERRPRTISNEVSTPQALGLLITLPKEIFVECFDKNGLRRATGERHKRYSVKWDVFFNGELAVSDFQSSRYAHGRDGVSNPSLENGNLRIVSGKRTNILLERPWVIVPPEQNADGSLREAKTSKAGIAGAEERWQALGKALLQRADEQGYNKREEQSPLGKYLSNLATLEMPEAVADMQKPGGHKFGVIDVVITAGQGTKGALSHHYVIKPEALVDTNYKQMPPGWDPSSARKQAAAQQYLERQIAATARDPSLGGLASTAAFTRERRSIATPASYRDAALRKSRVTTPEPSSTAPSERTSILPAFPTIPEIDFNDAIAITPTKAEEARRNRGAQTSSPSADALTRSHSATNMPPPPTIPRSAQNKKRRHSDAISVSSSSSSPTKPAVSSTRPGAVAGSKSVSGYMGMTRRGIFSKGPRMSAASPGPQLRSPGPTTIGSRSLASNTMSVSRVIISGGESAIVDKKLTSPYKLRGEANGPPIGQSHGSPHQPLDEFVLFSFRRATKSAASTTTHATPQPANPPVNPAFTSNMPFTATQPPSTLSTSIPPGQAPPPPQTPTPTNPTPAHTTIALKTSPQNTNPTSQPKPKPQQHDDILAEARASWVTPELSEDCVITFAQEGKWLNATGGKGSVLRHVKSGRAGVFTENEVVFAVRFVVAG